MRIKVLLLIAAAVFFTACGNMGLQTLKEEKAVYKSILPADAKSRMESGKDYVLLDVRTPKEHETAHIQGSLLIPLDQLDEEAGELLRDKDAFIMVYCRSGNRSKTAAKLLIEKGYTHVFDLGGIHEWTYEVVKK